MAENLSRSQKSASRQAGAGRSNASITLSHAGGAAAAHTAFNIDPVLTGLQSPSTDMTTAIDQTPRTSYPATEYNLPDFSNSFISFPHTESPLEGDAQFFLPDSSASPSRYLNLGGSPGDVGGVISHPPNPIGSEQRSAPWSHLTATEGRTPPVPSNTMDGQPQNPKYLTPVRQRRTNSNASAQDSATDSAYFTRPKSERSMQGGEPLISRPPEYMDQSPTYSHFYGQGLIPVPASPYSLSTANPPTYHNNPTPSEASLPMSISRQSQTSQRQSHNMCHECNYRAKTRSDLKKHNARHERNNKCPYHNCPRQAKGFATSNDLDRHLKSVHNQNNRNSKNYKCFAEGCARGDKEWPRLDNFKQHLRSMHKTLDQGRLLQLSEAWYASLQQNQTQPSQYQEQEPELQSNSDSSTLFPPGTMMASQRPYQGLYGDPTQSFHHQMPMSNMNAQSSTFNQTLDPNLLTTPNPHPQMPQATPRRRISSPMPHSRPQRPPNPMLNTTGQNLETSQMSMQRARSQTEFQQIQDNGQFQHDFSSQTVGYQFTTETMPLYFEQLAPPTMRPIYQYTLKQGQIQKKKAPNTIADPLHESNRMADFSSPQDNHRPVPDDLGGRQEEILRDMGGSTVADNMPSMSPHQGLVVKVTPPENETKTPKTPQFPQQVEEEIRSFLVEYESKSGKERNSFSQELLMARLRLTFDALTTEASSVTGAGDSEAPAGKVCPYNKETYYRCPHEGCKVFRSRQSELRKHMLRHEKPYGCTFDKCYKTFGSKNDWKRHEQGQHQQQDCWRCRVCFMVLYHRQENYIDHMCTEHPDSFQEDGTYNADHHKIPRNFQGQFWCGFCDQVIVHHQVGMDAVNCRFNHIAHHFIKEKKSSRSWIEIGGKGKTKKELQDESKAGSPAATEEDDEGVEKIQGESESSESSQGDSSPTQQSFSQRSSMISDSSAQQQSAAPTEFTPNPIQSEMMMMMVSDQQLMTSPVSQTPDQNNIQRSPHSHRSKPLATRHANTVKCCQCSSRASLELGKQCHCYHRYCQTCKFKYCRPREVPG